MLSVEITWFLARGRARGRASRRDVTTNTSVKLYSEKRWRQEVRGVKGALMGYAREKKEAEVEPLRPRLLRRC